MKIKLYRGIKEKLDTHTRQKAQIIPGKIRNKTIEGNKKEYK